jgi:hypothetical protein
MNPVALDEHCPSILQQASPVTTDANELGDSDPSPEPARPATLTVDFYEEPDGMAIHKKHGGGPTGFLLLWLSGWSVGCAVLVGAVLKQPAFSTFAFATPFWLAWLLVAGFLVWALFGKETLLLRADAALFQRTALIAISSRLVPRAEIVNFRECRSTATENDQHLWGIEMVTLGKPLRFAFRLPDQERAWLVSQLNRYLAATRIEGQPLPPAPTARPAGDTTPRFSSAMFSAATVSAPVSAPAAEILHDDQTLTEPPTDSAWRLDDDINALTFSKQGQLSIAGIVTLLFMAAFWNGILSMFLSALFGLMPAQNNNPPQGWEWWALFVFLIPFELVGLILILGVIFSILEPFRRTVWRFEQDRIAKQTQWPLYRHTRAWDVVKLDRLELRRQRPNTPQRQRLADSTTDMMAQVPFELALVAPGNVDLCRIPNLTEGEVRWIAHVILDRRAKWFPS